MLTRPQIAPLRFVAVRLGLPELETVARQPGVAEAFRLTIQYHDARHPDQVATAIQMQGDVKLTVIYRRANDEPLSLNFNIPTKRFRSVIGPLKKLGFDKLDDSRDLKWYGADLWLVERAASGFHHDIILAPDTASGIYSDIIKLIREHLRETVRAINP
jgi:hypothetical protein